MPREIIDTESSRPAYERRLLVRWILVGLVVIFLGFLAFMAWKASHPTPANLGLLSQKVGVS